MPRGGVHEVDEDGRGLADGEAGDGADQASAEHLGDPEGSLLGTRKSSWAAIRNVKYQRT